MHIKRTVLVALIWSVVFTGTTTFSTSSRSLAASQQPSPSPPPLQPSVLALQFLKADQAARILHGLYPHVVIRVHGAANAVIVVASPEDVAAMRSVITSIDVKNPTEATVSAEQLRQSKPNDVVAKLRIIFPKSRFVVGPNNTVIISADAQTLVQIHTVIGQFDTPPTPPTPKPEFPATAFRINQGDVHAIARAAARVSPNVQILVSGSNIIARGSPEDVAALKTVLAQIDQPIAGTRYTQVYRLTSVSAKSVGDLLSRSFREADISVDGDLNALSVTAPMHIQVRIADAIAQLDVAPNANTNGGPPGASSAFGGSNTEVINLHAVVPGPAGAASTSANDIMQTVTQALGQSAPDLHITIQPNSTRIILTGSPHSIELAKDLIAQLDVAEPLVELDTEVYEVDESVQKQLGFKFPTAALTTTYSELTPAASSSGVAAQLLNLQPLTRTPLSLQAELDFLVSTSRAKILEDPRITTFSGRTASLRAGETVNILTTTGGGTGTVATTQVQSFQTGVTLDITPVVNADDYITVTLHPSVNSEAGVSAAGVPNIQTRDTTTTVGLHDGETLVVGGLIEDSDSRTVQKIPFLGDLPLIGKLFQDTGVTHTRNELIVTVTPHILRDGRSQLPPPLPIPKPQGLPTLNPTATIPPSRTFPPPPTPAGQFQTPAPFSTPNVGDGGPTIAPAVPSPSSVQSASPGPTGSAAAPVPSAFAQTNVFTYGAAPLNNYAGSSSPPQIFFIQASPTVVHDGQTVTISVITSSNVTTLNLAPSAIAAPVTLTSVGTGKWQSTFNFNAGAFPSSTGTVNELLTASTALGGSTSIRIPFTILTQ